MIVVRNSESIRSIVRDKRKALGLTQTELARVLGRSRKWVSDFETGAYSPSLDVAVHALNALGFRVVLEELPDPSQEGLAPGWGSSDV